MATATAAVIMALVVIIGGVGAFFAFNAVAQTKTCAPASSAVCVSNVHDVSLLVPLRSTQQGSSIPFTAILGTGETSTAFTYSFGDGTSTGPTAASTVDHTYNHVGTYLATVTAVVSGVTHDNYQSIAVIGVTASYTQNSLGTYPSIAGKLVSNTSSTTLASGVLLAGQAISVSGQYTLAPTNPAYAQLAPTITASSGGAVSALVVTGLTASATVTFASPGIYTVTFVGGGVPRAGGGATYYQNFTWTAVVAPSAVHYKTAPSASAISPHPGQIISYEEAPAGGKIYDPAISYDTVSGEIDINTYQSLITYNGSAAGPDPANYVPQIATCVPGSAACAALYGGNTLLSGSDYTFVVSKVPQFYDPWDSANPAAGASWGVYPTDVMFSVMRTMGFSLYPGVATTAGWILSQSLLSACTLPKSPGSCFSWDGALHPYWNNTPKQMFNSMSINDSAWCPAAAMTNEHGCITFHVTGNNVFGGPSWPFFLELIADNLGGGITPAGWFSAPNQGQGIPYWTLGNVSNPGTHPVALPTGATSTTDAAYKAFVAALPQYGFDAWEQAYVNPNTGAYSGNTQFRSVASGPYYENPAGSVPHKSYELKASPVYTQNPHCTWTGCQPAPKTFASDVQVIYEATATPGENAYASGSADFATIPIQDTAFLLQLIQNGKLGATTIPSISIFQVFYAFSFATSREHTYTANPVTIPHDFFSYVGMRQFFAHAYPYATIESSVNTVDGLQYAFDIGGAIPTFMDGYTPTNIKWPVGDPCADPANQACPAFWWTAINTVGGPFYDPQAASCTKASPCQFPLYGELGAPDEDARLTLFINSVTSLTGGAIQMSLVDLSFGTLIGESFQPAGQTALPLSILAWAPDYPDPTDYTVPYYYPDSTYTLAGATVEQLHASISNSTLPGTAVPCPWGPAAWSGGPTAYNYYINISTDPTHPYPSIPQSCQGGAYDAAFALLLSAAGLPTGQKRINEFDYAELILQQLAMFIDEFQANVIQSYSSWIDGTSINTNVMIGSVENVWYATTGNGVAG
ncbi:MAG: PKD domain-containing protein [Thermoplasmata archaeon]|nr:PKD domain-containing protein [Thermoplasmata archaeon]